MSRCLSDRALLLAHAEVVDRRWQEHLAECARCADRFARIGGDLETITRVVIETAATPHARRTAPRVRRWLVATGALAAAGAVLLWFDATAWRAMTPDAPPRQDDVAALSREIPEEDWPGIDDLTDVDGLISHVMGTPDIDADKCAGLPDEPCNDDVPDLDSWATTGSVPPASDRDIQNQGGSA